MSDSIPPSCCAGREPMLESLGLRDFWGSVFGRRAVVVVRGRNPR